MLYMKKVGGATFCKEDLLSSAKKLKSFDYDFVELDLGLPILPNEEFENKLSQIDEIIPVLVGHLPFIDFKKDELQRCKEFIKIMSKVNTRLFAFHPTSLNPSANCSFQLKLNFLSELSLFAKTNGSMLLLENTEENTETLKNIFEKIPPIGFCLDVGHANLFSKTNRSAKMIQTFIGLLKHVHLHDNVGGFSLECDLHLPIGAGNINFERVLRKLTEVGYIGDITLEIHDSSKINNMRSIEKIKGFFN